MADGWTEITTNWKGELAFISTNEAGDSLQMGVLNGRTSIGPMQLLLAALAGCTGMDIVSILQKKRIELSDFQIRVRGKRAADYPMIWEEIDVTYYLWAASIKAADVEQAINLSEEKYCSVGIMLGRSARIHTDYVILKPGETLNKESNS